MVSSDIPDPENHMRRSWMCSLTLVALISLRWYASSVRSLITS